MSDWAVTIDQQVDEPLVDDQVDALLESLTQYGAALSTSAEAVSVTMTVDVSPDDPLKVLTEALAIWFAALKEAGVSAGAVVAAELLTADEQDRRLATPGIPEIWGAVEVASELNVSRQRVHQLLTDHPRFPRPFIRLGGGPLWLADTIRAFNERWERKPGRPRQVS